MSHSLSSYIPIGSLIASPRRTLSKAGLILALGIVWCVVIPTYLYKLCGALNHSDVEKILPDSSKTGDKNINPKREWEDYTDAKKGLAKCIQSIDLRMADAERNPDKSLLPNEAVLLVDQRAKLQQALESLESHPPFHIAGFYLDSMMFVWPAFYVCLAWLLLVFPPQNAHRSDAHTWIPLFLLTLFLYRVPTWLRNAPSLRYIERRIYADGNWDVSKGSFFVQESLGLGACVLLVAVWAVWSDFLPVWQARVRDCLWGTKKKLAEFIENYVRLFVHWQICSVLLAGAFIPYSFFFWDYVIEYGDKRYLAHAIIMHGLWGITWLLISLPLAWTWYQWNVRFRVEVATGAAIDTSATEKEKPLEMMTLVGSWNLFGSLAGAAIAYGFPVLKELLKHF